MMKKGKTTKTAKTPLKVIGYTRHPDNSGDTLWHMDFQGDDAEKEAVEAAIVEDIRKHGYVFSGGYHQYGLNGVPVLSDGSLYMCSMRHWGSIMYRAVYKDDEDPLGYCMYAWDVPEGRERPPHANRHVYPDEIYPLFTDSHPERYKEIILKMKEEDDE